MLCALCNSEKLDVEDHYVAWRQTHDSPQHAMGVDGPFSFCSYPFLLNPRAKSKLLHTEARFLMTQACHPATLTMFPYAPLAFVSSEIHSQASWLSSQSCASSKARLVVTPQTSRSI